MNDNAAMQREALRQQMLLRALWRDARPAVLQGWLRDAPERATRGLAAYRANAGAAAERALATTFPTVAALVGAESFVGLARAFWQAHAPKRGDLGELGADLPDFIAASEQLVSEAYLADSARLDWAVHRATRAADAAAEAADLQRLAEHDPSQLRLRLRPGCALVPSTWPIVAIWAAHRSDAPDRFAPVRTALDAWQGEIAFVWRDGFTVRVDALSSTADASFVQSLLAAHSLAQALDAAGPDFAFDRWLAQALQQRTLVAVDLPAASTPGTHPP